MKDSRRFKSYLPRKIKQLPLLEIDDWKIKLHLISIREEVDLASFMPGILNKLKSWTEQASTNDFPVYKVGFLIIHAGEDGVWVLFNWWTAGEMLATASAVIYPKQSNSLQAMPIEGVNLFCVWELHVVAVEKELWIEHVLKEGKGDLPGYLNAPSSIGPTL